MRLETQDSLILLTQKLCISSNIMSLKVKTGKIDYNTHLLNHQHNVSNSHDIV